MDTLLRYPRRQGPAAVRIHRTRAVQPTGGMQMNTVQRLICNFIMWKEYRSILKASDNRKRCTKQEVT